MGLAHHRVGFSDIFAYLEAYKLNKKRLIHDPQFVRKLTALLMNST